MHGNVHKKFVASRCIDNQFRIDLRISTPIDRYISHYMPGEGGEVGSFVLKGVSRGGSGGSS